MTVELAAAQSLERETFGDIKKICGHIYSQFLAKTKSEDEAKTAAAQWLNNLINDYDTAVKYLNSIKDKQ